MFLFFIRIAVFALVVYVVWRMLRPRYAVRIVMDEHGIKHHVGLSKAQERKVLEFLQEQMPDGKLTIYAEREPNGYLRLNIRGHITPGMRQRVRNFLNSVM